jgi:hypothetical protein
MPSDDTNILPFAPNPIEIYRNVRYEYNNNNNVAIGDVVCNCPCENQCTSGEKLFLNGTKPSPIKEIYRYFKNENYVDKSTVHNMFGSNTEVFPDGEWSTETGDDILNVNMVDKEYDDTAFNDWQKMMNRRTSACEVCNSIQKAIQNDKASTGEDTISAKLGTLSLGFTSKYQENKTQLENLSTTLNTQKSLFYSNTSKIQQLQKKIRLSHKLLNAQADKLKTYGQSFTSLQAQYKERNLNRVSIGIPYLKPFYTMSSRQFFVLMAVLNLIVVIIIGLYGFYPRGANTPTGTTSKNTMGTS